MPTDLVDANAESRALALFKELLRIDTSNPPGNEKPAAELCAEKLFEAGVEPRIVDTAPNRACVVARVKGDGTAPPLLLSAHLDVVPADPASWTHPPFAAVEADGWIWGRGAVDMKHHAAMSVTVLGLLKERGVKLARDVIFAGVADEEAGGRFGAHWLADKEPELVRAEYGLGEIGGFSLHLSGRTYYPIQVAEKGFVWFTVTAKGVPAHGSIPREDNAVVRLAEAVAKLGRKRLPVHVTEPVRRFVSALAAPQSLPVKAALKALLAPGLSHRVIRVLPDQQSRRVFAALLSNTANPTMVTAGVKANVIPGEATATFDGRVLPGHDADELLREVRAVIGDGYDLHVFDEEMGTETTPDGPLYEALGATIAELEPGAHAIPYVIPGFTDAGAFKKVGVRWFGFSPVKFPPDCGVAFSELYHANDERIPVDGFKWGLRALAGAVTRFCAKA